MKTFPILLLCAIFYSGALAQTRHKFYVRAVLNTEDGAPLNNLNFDSDVTVNLLSTPMGNGNYRLDVKKAVGESVIISVNNGELACVNIIDAKIPVSAENQPAIILIFCKKAELKDRVVAHMERQLGKKGITFDNNKTVSVLPALIANSRSEALFAGPDTLLASANSKFIQGNYAASKSGLLKKKPFETFAAASKEVQALEKKRETERQKLLLLGDLYLVEGNMDSAIITYEYVTPKDSSADMLSVFKIYALYQMVGDIQGAVTWSKVAQTVKLKDGNDSTRATMALVLEQLNTRGFAALDKSKMEKALQDIHVTDYSLRLGLGIILAGFYYGEEKDAEATKLLRTLSQDGSDDELIASLSAVKSLYMLMEDDDALDSVNEVYIARLQMALAAGGSNNDFYRLSLYQAQFDRALRKYGERWEDDDKMEVDTAFSALYRQFLAMPGWQAEVLLLSALPGYMEEIVLDMDEDSDIEAFMVGMISRLKGMSKQYEASMLLAYLYWQLADWYTDDDTETRAAKAYLECIRYAAMKPWRKPVQQQLLVHYLGEILLEKEQEKPAFRAGLKQAMAYYWTEQAKKDFRTPLILNAYGGVFNATDVETILKIFALYQLHLPLRPDDQAYWESYKEFMDEVQRGLTGANTILLKQLLESNQKMMTAKLEKEMNTPADSSNMFLYGSLVIDNNVRYKLRGQAAAATAYIEEQLLSTRAKVAGQPSYRHLLDHVLLTSVPLLAERAWEKDTTQYRTWKRKIDHYLHDSTWDPYRRKLLDVKLKLAGDHQSKMTDTLSRLIRKSTNVDEKISLFLQKVTVLKDSSVLMVFEYDNGAKEAFLNPDAEETLMEAYAALGKYYLLTGKKDSAVHYAQQAALLSPDARTVKLVQGVIALYNGDKEQALIAFREAGKSIKIFPANSKNPVVDQAKEYLASFIGKGIDQKDIDALLLALGQE